MTVDGTDLGWQVTAAPGAVEVPLAAGPYVALVSGGTTLTVADASTGAPKWSRKMMWVMTAPSVVKALVEAKHRGVDVRVITDRERLNDPKQHSAVNTLRLAGVPVRINRHDALMHLKQVVIDDHINTSGSANHTTSGNRYNDERLDVITDARLTAKAREKFLAMWNDHERFVVWTE